MLNDAEARAQAENRVEPKFSKEVPKGSVFRIRVSVDQNGKDTGVLNIGDVPVEPFMSMDHALLQWKWKPLIRDGKPVYFHAVVEFVAR